MLVDSHCHLNFNAFDEDRLLVVQRAQQAGVIRILNPGIDLPSSRAAVKLAGEFPALRVAVGVHPNEASAWDETSLDELRRLAGQPGVVAIGEIGLDYYRERASHAQQREAFRGQLELAAQADLPVVIHIRAASENDRRAITDALELLGEWQLHLTRLGSPLAESPGVLHSFSGNLEEARRAVEMNFYIGVSGPVTYKNASDLHQVVSKLPLESLLIETDAPFLTPQPHRGQRNEPAYVGYVAEKIAALRGQEINIIQNQTTENAGRLFHW